ncbi:hypothetical protein SDJN03_12040, partial [Cucurbita argyrosperma subsp. sororia]
MAAGHLRKLIRAKSVDAPQSLAQRQNIEPRVLTRWSATLASGSNSDRDDCAAAFSSAAAGCGRRPVNSVEDSLPAIRSEAESKPIPLL